ncbi:fungal cellulose binding domain-containing protein [Neurospora crassa OR74A]|uniref:lytic cellulose monooxygenase (C4-dehydrogenating) n=2 Tax=Neurospora crassa TaxID=5141 RepID=Q7S411_NEUCR|nr:fungal cellulose binding domain-containing protein [Neurospora crassa OR74A]EAA30230.1 fungal cellulose binding domain-containing protein [Neurospora crassa OR74A]CAF05857.1 related to cellulose binding protein CEL1 [Neurospora crassa]|eukprot:XP_959466.1 fungal cellulose binding domain-containing protein [Neurospora crassa OR74A]
MKFSSALAFLAAAGAQAHYTFPKGYSTGAVSGEYEHIRMTENHYNRGPVADVTSESMTCYELNPGKGAPKTLSVAAGSNYTFVVGDNIGHPGPLHFYMAKVPEGKTAATFDGKGAVWFKIYQDGPMGLGTGQLTWPSAGATEVSVKLPSCLESGEYLLRVEHIGLHSAGSVGGAQLYIACAQLNVTGGTGTINTSGKLVSFPGAYKATDPGLLFNLYYPAPTSYTNPGPAVATCDGASAPAAPAPAPSSAAPSAPAASAPSATVPAVSATSAAAVGKASSTPKKGCKRAARKH